MKQPTLDVPGVIRKFGGRAQLYRKLSLAKIQLSPRTLDNWVYHEIIPMHRFLQLIALAKQEGFKLNLNEYIKNERTGKANSASTGAGNRNVENDDSALQTESSER
jgi:hypothetical protein